MIRKNKLLKLVFILLTIIIIIGNTVYGNEIVQENKIESTSYEVMEKKNYKSSTVQITTGTMPGATTVDTTGNVVHNNSENNSNTNSDSDGLGPGDILDGVAGILLLPAKAIIILVGEAIRIVLGAVAGKGFDGLSIQTILFNDLPITDINFFDFNSSNIDPTVKAIRQNVATWYIGIRNLSAVLLVIVAIYVGIRMATTTIAEDKAKYKQMLIDWLTSLCLLFILHYIMIIVIQLNNTLVKTIGESVKDPKLNDVAREFANQAWASINFSKGMAEGLAFLLIELMTIIFLISYIKRMITIGFLIIIAPLVTVTYSIDKMGDGKSQALNEWFKEFIYNILIQPFQCVTYLALCAAAFDLLDSSKLQSAVLAICMLIFLNTSETIIKHIFNFRAESMTDTFKNAAIMTAALKGFSNIGKNIAGGGNNGGDSPSEKMQRENRRERALPTNNSRERGIQTSDIASDEAIAAGASAAALDSANEEREYYSNNTNSEGAGRDSKDSEDNKDREKKNKEKDKKKSSTKLAKAGKIVIGANTLFLGAAIGTAAGAATGDFQAAITGGISGLNLARGKKEKLMNAIRNREIKNRTSSAILDYSRQRGNISDDQLIEEGMQLLDGTRDAKTDAERELRDALMEMYDRRVKLGDDEVDGLENTKKTMQELLDKNREKNSSTTPNQVKRYTRPIKEKTTPVQPVSEGSPYIYFTENGENESDVHNSDNNNGDNRNKARLGVGEPSKAGQNRESADSKKGRNEDTKRSNTVENSDNPVVQADAKDPVLDPEPKEKQKNKKSNSSTENQEQREDKQDKK